MYTAIDLKPPSNSLGRILLVEDDPLVAQSFQLWLLLVVRCDVVAVQTPAEAALVALARRVDLVLHDYDLAGERAEESIARLREILPATVRILVVSGALDPSRAHSCRAAGANDCIDKMDVDAIERAVARSVSR